VRAAIEGDASSSTENARNEALASGLLNATSVAKVRPARTALSILVAFSLPLYLTHRRFSLHFVGSSLDSDEVCMPLVR
jgi:hypothetical protein